MWRRIESFLLTIALFAAFSACGTTGPKPAVPSPSIQTSIRAPSPAGSPSVGAIGAGKIWVVSLPDTYRFHRPSSDGPRVVLDEVASGDDAYADSLVLVDLATQSWRRLATAAAGHHPWDPVIREETVAWVEWRYSAPLFAGTCDWRMLVTNLSTGAERVIASGVNTRLEGDGAPPPPLALDSTDLAYAIQNSSPSRPWGWQIVILDLASGRIVRKVTTDEEIYGFGLSNGVVVYSEGLVDPSRGFVYKTRLMISAPSDVTPRQLASDAFEISFRDGRLAWVQDPFDSQHQSGLERTARVWTASAPSWEPSSVTPTASTPSAEQQWPAASSAGVSFEQSQQLWWWQPATGRAAPVPGSESAVLSSQGSGWLTWDGGVTATRSQFPG
jgi:hypothetical protein